MLRDNFIEAFLQGQKLSLNTVQETPVHIQPAANQSEEGREETLHLSSCKVQIQHCDTEFDIDSLPLNICVNIKK